MSQPSEKEAFIKMASLAGIFRDSGMSDERGRSFVIVAGYGNQYPATAMFWFDGEGNMEGTLEASDKLRGF